MSYLLEVCLVVTLATAITPSATAQSQPGAPLAMQKGVSVQLPITANAIAIPDADQPDAVIVSITNDGSVYVGVDRVTFAALADAVKVALANRTENKLYLKADARTPYSNVVTVIDALRASGVEALTLLTAQPESPSPGTIVPPKGIRVRLISHCPQTQI